MGLAARVLEAASWERGSAFRIQTVLESSFLNPACLGLCLPPAPASHPDSRRPAQEMKHLSKASAGGMVTGQSGAGMGSQGSFQPILPSLAPTSDPFPEATVQPTPEPQLSEGNIDCFSAFLAAAYGLGRPGSLLLLLLSPLLFSLSSGL